MGHHSSTVLKHATAEPFLRGHQFHSQLFKSHNYCHITPANETFIKWPQLIFGHFNKGISVVLTRIKLSSKI